MVLSASKSSNSILRILQHKTLHILCFIVSNKDYQNFTECYIDFVFIYEDYIKSNVHMQCDNKHMISNQLTALIIELKSYVEVLDYGVVPCCVIHK